MFIVVHSRIFINLPKLILQSFNSMLFVKLRLRLPIRITKVSGWIIIIEKKHVFYFDIC